jgi:hypothetical protein
VREMGKITAGVIIGILILLFYSHIEGQVQDAVMDQTEQSVLNSNLDQNSKGAVTSYIFLVEIAGIIGTIVLFVTIFKKLAG